MPSSRTKKKCHKELHVILASIRFGHTEQLLFPQTHQPRQPRQFWGVFYSIRVVYTKIIYFSICGYLWWI